MSAYLRFACKLGIHSFRRSIEFHERHIDRGSHCIVLYLMHFVYTCFDTCLFVQSQVSSIFYYIGLSFNLLLIIDLHFRCGS